MSGVGVAGKLGNVNGGIRLDRAHVGGLEPQQDRTIGTLLRRCSQQWRRDCGYYQSNESEQQTSAASLGHDASGKNRGSRQCLTDDTPAPPLSQTTSSSRGRRVAPPETPSRSPK
jgi:hypothetical protein